MVKTLMDDYDWRSPVPMCEPMVRPALQLPGSFDNILANAEALVPWLAAQSNEADSVGRIGSDVMDALIAAGVFRICMPASWGGPELDSLQQLLVIEALSKADASVGWCVATGSDAGLYSGYLDDAVARNLYPHLDVIQAGWIHPVGRADRSDGAYQVTGNWQFGSCMDHADLVAAGCIVYENDEPVIGPGDLPEWRIVLAPRAHWRVTEPWDATGLRSTASHAYTTELDSLLIPEEHSFSFLRPVRAGTLWQRPDTLLRKLAGVPLGLARRAIDDTLEILNGKTDRQGIVRVATLPRVKSAVADAEMILGRARSYVLQALEAQWRKFESSAELTKQERGDVWLSRLNAFQAARQVTLLLYDTIGADAVFRAGSLDRHLRDATTLCQHVAGQRKELETVGGFLLETESGPTSPML